MDDAENVIPFTGITTLPTDPARVLSYAAKQKFSRVVIVGALDNGEEYFASSDADGGSILWDLERVKLRLLRVPDEFEEGNR